MKFNIIAFDQTGKAACQDATGLLDSFRGCSHGWGVARPKIDEQAGLLNWEAWRLQVKQVSDSAAKNSPTSGKAFLVEANGEHSTLEPFRLKIAAHLNTVGLRPIYVLRDEVSEEIAGRLYLNVYRLENRLREYLTRFYCTIYGADFWPVAAAKLVAKANDLQGNERVFREYTDTTAYRITFDDLGGIVFKAGTNQPDVETLIQNVRNLVPDQKDQLEALQKSLEPNYERFFKGLKSGGFKKKWDAFSFYRNKIAHNNLFIAEDELEVNRLYADLIKLIEGTETEIETLQQSIPESERAEMQDELLNSAVGLNGSNPATESPLWTGPGTRFSSITKEEFLKELAELEKEHSAKGRGFVGLKRFIEYHLGALGYDYTSAWKTFEMLLSDGQIEKYEVQNKFSEFSAVAIRSVYKVQEAKT